MEKNILLDGGKMLYCSEFITKKKADQYLQALTKETPWRQDKITIFGKTHNVPRLQAWYGDENARYSYSNIDLEPLPWTEQLKEIKNDVEQLARHHFNSVLINLYRNGQDSNGWHSDDEKELGANPVIASVTLGQERIFHLKHKTKQLKSSILLEHGSLLIMKGEMQHHWKHQIPKSKKVLRPRINLTFRKIYV